MLPGKLQLVAVRINHSHRTGENTINYSFMSGQLSQQLSRQDARQDKICSVQKGNPQEGRALANHIFDKDIEILHKILEDKSNWIKNGQRPWTEISPGRLANDQLAQEKCSGPPNTRSTSQNPNKTFHPIEWLQLKTNMNQQVLTRVR